MVVVGERKPWRRRQLCYLAQVHVRLLVGALPGQQDVSSGSRQVLLDCWAVEVLKHQHVLEGMIAAAGIQHMIRALVIYRHAQGDLVVREAVE